VQRIRDIIAERKLTQSRAAALLGLDQPKVSALVRSRVDGYSLDRLFRFLNASGSGDRDQHPDLELTEDHRQAAADCRRTLNTTRSRCQHAVKARLIAERRHEN
jgi:predicted transcriptional regulator